jgi:hypothetical protein
VQGGCQIGPKKLEAAEFQGMNHLVERRLIEPPRQHAVESRSSPVSATGPGSTDVATADLELWWRRLELLAASTAESDGQRASAFDPTTGQTRRRQQEGQDLESEVAGDEPHRRS